MTIPLEIPVSPFQRRCSERVSADFGSPECRINEYAVRQHDPGPEDKGANRRPLMEYLKLRIISSVTARHAAGTHHELGKKRQVESRKYEEATDTAQEIVVHPAEKFWPPVKQTAEKRRQRSRY